MEFVDINPADLEEALATGKVDAVMVWEQWADKIESAWGDKIVSWPGQGGQKYYWLLVTTDALAKTRPEVLERLFRALDQAEIFLKSHPEESIGIIARQINLDPAIIKAAYDQKQLCFIPGSSAFHHHGGRSPLDDRK